MKIFMYLVEVEILEYTTLLETFLLMEAVPIPVDEEIKFPYFKTLLKAVVLQEDAISPKIQPHYVLLLGIYNYNYISALERQEQNQTQMNNFYINIGKIC